MNKTIIASLILALSISSVNAGWNETFETAATPNSTYKFTSDRTWVWGGWGTADACQITPREQPFLDWWSGFWIQ